MIRKLSFVLIPLLWFHPCTAQLSEDFSDGNFTSNPAWFTSNNADWVINANGQLQSNTTTANSSFFAATANTLAIEAQWEFWVRLAFNPSSANYVDVYLTASSGNLAAGSTTGYFVRFGNTQDEISLYRKDANGTIVRLIDGADGSTDKSDNPVRIKVTRNAANQFTLYRDTGGSGNNYTSEGSATDSTYNGSAFFGFLVRQSTASFFQKHFFDDVAIAAYRPDLTPPSLVSATATSSTTVDLLFSETVDPLSAQQVANYTAGNGLGQPAAALRDSANTALVHLRFSSSFGNGQPNTITVKNVADPAGNVLQLGTADFSFYTPQTYDLVIDEIMADPSPPVGLPDAEFIELKNNSGHTINLQGWRLETTTASSAAFPAYALPADSFLVLTSTSAVPLFLPYGKVLGIGSFPALSNDGALLQVFSSEGKLIHAVNYTSEWYENAVKAQGGWSLETIDPKNACAGSGNWKSSANALGGTPGKKNSVDGVIDDNTPPQLLRTYLVDSTTVVALFSEPLDSTAASQAIHYTCSHGLMVVSARAQPPLFNSVRLQLSAAVQKRTVYSITASQVTDCRGNAIGAFNQAKAGRPEEASAFDVVLNEILFDPKPTGDDYVEFYNRSAKIIDASALFFATLNSAGGIASPKKLTDEPYYLFPGDFLVIAPDKASVQRNFFVKNESALLPLSSMPSLPADKATVLLLNGAGESIDKVGYSKDWHFALIDNPEGIALERIDPDGASQEKRNWHSAASTAGYGTPTYKNSQYKLTEAANATIRLSPNIFSPDNDGRDDVATITYRVEERGFVANVFIFDASGRLVRQLVKNDLLALNGTWQWDGLGEKNNKLPVGAYVVFTEIFTLDGKKQGFKNTIVLARALN